MTEFDHKALYEDKNLGKLFGLPYERCLTFRDHHRALVAALQRTNVMTLRLAHQWWHRLQLE